MSAEKVTLRVHEGSIQAKYANLGMKPTPAAWHEYILMKDAKHLWKKAVWCAKEKKGYTPRGLGSIAHVGWEFEAEYHDLLRDVHKITSKGTLFIGCGKVSLAEMNKIAKELGWKDS